MKITPTEAKESHTTKAQTEAPTPTSSDQKQSISYAVAANGGQTLLRTQEKRGARTIKDLKSPSRLKKQQTTTQKANYSTYKTH